jgi:hypothetical protein
MLFGAHPDKEGPTIDHVENLVDHLHNIHSYTRQNLKLASDPEKPRYDKLTNCASYRKGDKMWLYRSTPLKRKSPSSNAYGKAHTR